MIKMPRNKITKMEWKTILDTVLYGVPMVMFAIGLREWVLENVAQVNDNFGIMVFGLAWLLVVYYFRKKK